METYDELKQKMIESFGIKETDKIEKMADDFAREKEGEKE